MSSILEERPPVLHIRFDGQSHEIYQSDLDIGPSTSDQRVKDAAARHLRTDASKLNAFIVERHVNGNLTLRPEAVFGLA